MTLSRLKSGNGLPLRWLTCMGSSISMSLPSPAGTPLTHTSYTWTTVRSSTSARSINLVNNPIQHLSPHGTPMFVQTHDGDSPACLRVRHSSLDESWSSLQGVLRPGSKRGMGKPWHHDLRSTSTGRHARRTIEAWHCLKGPIHHLLGGLSGAGFLRDRPGAAALVSLGPAGGERRGEGRAASGSSLAIQRLSYADLDTALGFGIVWVSPCSRALCCLRLSEG
jgi:hypothetical protein